MRERGQTKKGGGREEEEEGWRREEKGEVYTIQTNEGESK